MHHFIVFALLLLFFPSLSEAADCPDAAVVVVASVFATLAVVFIVLGIIAFLIWKRRRDISRPEKLRQDGGSETGSPSHMGYSNPAFEKGEKDPETGGNGIPGYVACKDSLDKKKSPVRNILDKEMAKKTWSSLPKSDFLNMNRQNSVGSLDRNFSGGDPEIESVWLQSQDFIGLGFNIAGSMRDGIFVSQVHNRGPAIESGKFKVGDRILSVTVSFENMVYEDALTILSYASPYPVQICLQKQEQMPKSRRISTTKTSLNHPLYRSQSVDALHGLGKELMFHPKRSLSEMRPDKRDSPKLKHVSKSSIENDISEEINLANGKANQSPHKSIPVPTTAEVIVHRDDSRNDVKKEISYDKQFSIDTGLPNATVDLNHRNENKIDTRLANQTREGTDELDSAAQLRQDSNHTGFVDEFSKLTEQDKLDVLRLSYEDSNVDFSNIVQNHVVETEIAPTVVDGDLKAAVAPVKPERKKKRNSSSSLDGDIPISPRSLSADDDAIVAILQPPTEAPPPVPEGEQEFEADEEIITPQSKERIISVDTEKISFEPITPVKLDMSDISIDKTITGHDESFSDADKTLVNSPSQFDRPPSPDEAPVIEDEIAPTQLRKGDLQMTALNIITNFETKHRQRAPDMNTPLPEKVNNETNAINETEKLQVGNNSSVDEFENEFPNLDMNLNFESDSVLFKDTFPSRNTKENDGGMSYDISVTELEAMENKKLKELAEQNDNQKSSGGIAFEVRDDYVSGNQHTVTTKSVHRTSSYDISKSNESPLDRIKLSDRPNSMKVDIKKSSEFDNGDLNWSGKRLVRSGSFTEIPQDDSVKSWTDNNNLSEDDIVIEKLIQEDSASTNLKKLTKATSIKATTIIDELSDSDSHCRSLSSSSSESSQERESYNITTNGPDDGLGSSPDSSPVKIKSDMKSEIISPISNYSEKGQSITVTLNTSMENDEDC